MMFLAGREKSGSFLDHLNFCNFISNLENNSILLLKHDWASQIGMEDLKGFLFKWYIMGILIFFFGSVGPGPYSWNLCPGNFLILQLHTQGDFIHWLANGSHNYFYPGFCIERFK